MPDPKETTSRKPLATQDLTLKQRKWLHLYIKTGNATEAAMQAYDCKDRESAANIGWENVRKLDYTAFLEEAGVTDKLLQQKILEGLDATKVVSAKILVLGGDKEADSKTDDFIDVPDFLARHKFLETALKLKKRFAEDSVGGFSEEATFVWRKK